MELILVVVGAIVVGRRSRIVEDSNRPFIVMVGIAACSCPDSAPELDSHILLTVVLPRCCIRLHWDSRSDVHAKHPPNRGSRRRARGGHRFRRRPGVLVGRGCSAHVRHRVGSRRDRRPPDAVTAVAVGRKLGLPSG